MAIESVEKKYMYVWASTDDKGAEATFMRASTLPWKDIREEIDKCKNLKSEQLQLNLQECSNFCQKGVKIEQEESEIDERFKKLLISERKGVYLNDEPSWQKKLCFLNLYITFFKKYLVLDNKGTANARKLKSIWLEWRELPEARSICVKEYSVGLMGFSKFIRSLIEMPFVHHGSYIGIRLKTKEELAQ